MTIIGFYSVTPNVGKRTIALTAAKSAAENNIRTLYIELDYFRPQLAISQGITHDEKNAEAYFLKSIEKDQYSMEPYILKMEDLEINKKTESYLKDIPNNLHFLGFSKNYKPQMFPYIEEDTTEKTLEKRVGVAESVMEQIKQLDYELVILNFPNRFENIFCLPMMVSCDSIVNVLTPTIEMIGRYKEIKETYRSVKPESQNWMNVLNMVPPTMDEGVYKGLADNIEVIIDFDDTRVDKELTTYIGSVKLKAAAEDILRNLGMEIDGKRKRKNFFSRNVG